MEGRRARTTTASEGDYRARRARAHRAYDEWMPVRMNGTADLRDGTRLFRRLQFGSLAELSMLDLRTYRDQQVASSVAGSPVGPAADAEMTTRTGPSPAASSSTGSRTALRTGGPQWKLVGNPVMIAPVTFAQLPDGRARTRSTTSPVCCPTTGWPTTSTSGTATPTTVARCSRTSATGGVRDAVFLTGDIHSGWACDLPYDASTYPAVGDSAGVELVCSSVTSNNLKDITGSPSRTTSIAVEATIKANNRHIKYLNFDDHGFSVLDITPARVQMDWFVIGDRADKRTGDLLDRVLRLRLRDPEAAPGRQAGGCLMCGPEAVGASPGQPAGTERRTFLKVLGAGGATVLFSSAMTAPATARAAQARATCWCSTGADRTRSAAA